MGGGYFGVNFGHLKSEVFQNGGGGAFWSEIPERGFLENLDKNLLFSQKPACASQIVSHILRMWRLIKNEKCYRKLTSYDLLQKKICQPEFFYTYEVYFNKNQHRTYARPVFVKTKKGCYLA